MSNPTESALRADIKAYVAELKGLEGDILKLTNTPQNATSIQEQRMRQQRLRTNLFERLNQLATVVRKDQHDLKRKILFNRKYLAD